MDEKIRSFIKSKKAQVAIWVILAVLLVASISLLFIFKVGPSVVKPAQTDVAFDIQAFLQECTADAVTETVDKMLPQGGFVTPKNYVRYNGSNVEYICLNVQNYYPCINQRPMLLYEMKEEIKNYSLSKINICLNEMQQEYRKKGADIEFLSPLALGVEWGPDKIELNITRKTKITKQGETRSFDNFKIEVQNPAYNLAIVAVEIASQEATRCYFESVGYSISYPRYNIELYNQMPDATKIYTITDKKSKKFMQIAIRSCALPRGLR